MSHFGFCGGLWFILIFWVSHYLLIIIFFIHYHRHLLVILIGDAVVFMGSSLFPSSRLSPSHLLQSHVDLNVRLAGALVQRSVSVREEGRQLGWKKTVRFGVSQVSCLTPTGALEFLLLFGGDEMLPTCVTVSKKTKNPYKPIRISFILRVFFTLLKWYPLPMLAPIKAILCIWNQAPSCQYIR